MSPASILGHLFAGVAMTVTIPWAAVEAAVFLGACMAVGAIGGLVVTGIRVVREGRHGAH